MFCENGELVATVFQAQCQALSEDIISTPSAFHLFSLGKIKEIGFLFYISHTTSKAMSPGFLLTTELRFPHTCVSAMLRVWPVGQQHQQHLELVINANAESLSSLQTH